MLLAALQIRHFIYFARAFIFSARAFTGSSRELGVVDFSKITCVQYLLIQHCEMYVNLPSYKIMEFLQIATR